ncbi:MAG: hypothetical protein RL154_1415, partial [Pseudomonadota bacterium]
MKPLFYSTSKLDEAARYNFDIGEELQMEHAALGIKKYISHNIKSGAQILIVCGCGNNGADGYALARLLCGNYSVKVLPHEEPKSKLAILQAKRAKALNIEFCKMPGSADVVVDAIFGSGLARTLSAKTIGLLQKLNALCALKIACDVSTGIFANGNTDTIAFKADVTITMGAAKLSLYSDNAKNFVGNVITAELGVPFTNFCNGFAPDGFLLETKDMKLPFRNNPNSNKGDFGFVCTIAGNKSGAAILAALAANRFGAGLSGIYGATQIPEQIITLDNIPKNATLIAGCGLGTLSNEILQPLLKCEKA